MQCFILVIPTDAHNSLGMVRSILILFFETVSVGAFEWILFKLGSADLREKYFGRISKIVLVLCLYGPFPWRREGDAPLNRTFVIYNSVFWVWICLWYVLSRKGNKKIQYLMAETASSPMAMALGMLVVAEIVNILIS